MKKKNVYIASAVRTPIGGYGGVYRHLNAVQLGTQSIIGALAKAGTSGNVVDEVYMGNVLQAGLGQSPARQAAIKAGIRVEADATTINKVCSSGMKAVSNAFTSIILDKAQVVVAGGMESMSNAPFYNHAQRWGNKMGHTTLIDGLLMDGLTDPYHQFHMGNAAEICVRKFGFSREEQDAYARNSYEKAIHATQNGLFKNELIEVVIGAQMPAIHQDEDLAKVNFEKMPSLKPSFEQGGTITPANASNLNDGAAALVLTSEEGLKHTNAAIARLIDYADAAQEPEWFTTSPAIAIQKLLTQNALSVNDIDVFEINEAYACVPMANAQLLNIPLEKVNILGGAVAIGHPIGASGARIIATLINALHLSGGRMGVAAICNGGGGASAILVERMN